MTLSQLNKYLSVIILLQVLIFFSCHNTPNSNIFNRKFSVNDSISADGKRYITWGILFAFDKPNSLLGFSQPTLDSMSLFLLENDNLAVEIGVHSNLRGSDKYNDRLTQERASSLKEYFITKGIEKERLFAKGYGKNKPLSSDTTLLPLTTSHGYDKKHSSGRVELTIFQVDFGN